MEAVRKIKHPPQVLFRHCAKDVEIERKCTFSNQDYRQTAIDILQHTKESKYPISISMLPMDHKPFYWKKPIEANALR
jgi:hypothetical protein